MTAYYNENDPYAAEWLRNLIAAGHIASGVVDERDIRDIEAFELFEFTQCHFFAGIGIWSHALRRSGWSDDRPIWTGSCPCQPFSAAGKQKGFSDDRHLWPYWFDLIRECRPPVVLGEQVASALDWLDLVSADMEAADYTFGASDLCAAGFSGAHLRQRLYFVALADAASERRDGLEDPAWSGGWPSPENSGGIERLAEPHGGQRQRLADGEGRQLDGPAPGWIEGHGELAAGIDFRGLADAGREGRPQWRPEPGDRSITRSSGNGSGAIRNPGQARSFDHDNVDWLLCRNPAGEPSWRPVESGSFPLAHGVAGRMGKLRAYGNGLDAETATQFCAAVREIVEGV